MKILFLFSLVLVLTSGCGSGSRVVSSIDTTRDGFQLVSGGASPPTTGLIEVDGCDLTLD